MSPEDIKKLLGGYATGTLTAEEQQALFAAALEDQELFDALAREQSLRDLLRDPAARAELLSALDAPASRSSSFWQWLRRPMVAALAVAAVAEIALLGVAIWKGRAGSVKPAPVIVAELKRQDPVPAVAPAAPPSPARRQPEAKSSPRAADIPAVVLQDKKQSFATEPPSRSAALQALTSPKAETEVAALPPPPATVSRPATPVPEIVTLDARALFYANQPAPGANAFVAPSGGGGAAPPPVLPAAPLADAAPRKAKATTGFVASMMAAAPRLGVRVSILRGSTEVDLTTVLDPGETVRLKVTPNADGFLYVAEGSRLVASGAAQRLKPFETPELRFQGTGQKQLWVMFSRSPRTVDPLALASQSRGDLVETSPDRERATYVVSGPNGAGAPQVVVPVTLTYR